MKNKKWLWFIGWIVIFPIPLTILLLRKRESNADGKIAIIVFAWALYIFIGLFAPKDTAKDSSERRKDNIKSLKIYSDHFLIMNLGETVSPGYVKVKKKFLSNFKPEDVVFVSEDPNVAKVRPIDDGSDKELYFQISSVGGGETKVYARSVDGGVQSDVIQVKVLAPVEIEKIEIGEVRRQLIVGEREHVETAIFPANADDKILTWHSSDVGVATVDQEGNILGVGDGTATITVQSSNGVGAAFEVNVDGSKTLMNVVMSSRRDDDVRIGHEWSYELAINEEPIFLMGGSTRRQVGVTLGETLTFSATITEHDEIPDIGTGSAEHTVTEEDLVNGFEISFDVYVTENGGRNRGKSAHFLVSYSFSPN